MLAKDLIEDSDMGQEDWVAAGPLMVIEIGGQEFHFDEGLALGMEVTAGVAAEVFDLIVEAFG